MFSITKNSFYLKVDYTNEALEIFPPDVSESLTRSAVAIALSEKTCAKYFLINYASAKTEESLMEYFASRGWHLTE